MARVDDFIKTIELAAAELAPKDFAQVARLAGAETDGKTARFAYYGRPVEVTLDPLSVAAVDDGPELPLQEQGLILHYLNNADGAPPAGEWITFREVQSGEFYLSAFLKRTRDPLLGVFGRDPKVVAELGPLVGGEVQTGSADVEVKVAAFPNVPLLIQLWEGDDEFPAEGAVLLDKNIEHYLSTEDVALAAGLPIYKMMALARNR